MILDLCQATKNFFVRASEQGNFKIENNSISTVTNTYLPNQYVAIVGGIFANGIYQIEKIENGTLSFAITDGPLDNEEFFGTIYGLAIPRTFIELAHRIENYVAKNPESNLTSYSFGISSASYAVNESGMQATWQDVFSKELMPYRKMFKDVPL